MSEALVPDEIMQPGDDGEVPADSGGLPAAVKKLRQNVWRKEEERMLPCIFTPEEMTQRAASLTRTTLEIARHEEEKKNLTASLTQRIKAAKTEQAALARELDKGGESRMVPCETIRDIAANLFCCVRRDTNEVIESRELTDKEKQGRLL